MKALLRAVVPVLVAGCAGRSARWKSSTSFLVEGGLVIPTLDVAT